MRPTIHLALVLSASLALTPVIAQDAATTSAATVEQAEAVDQEAQANAIPPDLADDVTAATATAESGTDDVVAAPMAPEVAVDDPESAVTEAAPTGDGDVESAEIPPTNVPSTDEPGTTPEEGVPADASAIHIPAPPAGMGQVVFFRERKFTGGGVRFKVRENGEELGKLASGVYFVHVTPPGPHEYVVHSESEDVLTLEVEDGETYYVQGSITMGLLVGRPNLSPADEVAFAAAAPRLKPAKN